MVIYLISNMSTPYNLAPYVNNSFGYGSLILLALLLLLHSNPIVTILFIVFAFVFVNRSRSVDHNIMKTNEVNKNRAMQDYHENKNNNIRRNCRVHVFKTR